MRDRKGEEHRLTMEELQNIDIHRRSITTGYQRIESMEEMIQGIGTRAVGTMDTEGEEIIKFCIVIVEDQQYIVQAKINHIIICYRILCSKIKERVVFATLSFILLFYYG